MLEAQRQQFGAMQQGANAQLAQAQLQFAAMQQQAAPPPVAIGSGSIDPSILRSQLEASKALIDSKHYAPARSLLKTINHPKAIEWLATMDSKGMI